VVVVLGHVLGTGHRGEMGKFEAALRLEGEHRALVLVVPAVVLARPGDGAADLPV
jgi:hypothetical protein